MTHVLIVDPNEAFATLLGEELQRQGYEVVQAEDEEAARAAARRQEFDLAIIDMGLESPLPLARDLRRAQPNLRLMLIPLMGQDLDEEVEERIAIQGVLPKPFFLPDLPQMIEAALQAPLAPEPPAPVEEPVEEIAPQPAPSAAPQGESLPDRTALNANRAAIRELLDDLAREVSANAVLLTYGEEIALWVGTLPAATVQAVADAALQGWRTSAEVARALGREQGRFEQSISGGDYMLYAVSVAPHALLAIAIQGTTSLGLLRLNARGTAREIAALCCTD